MKTTSFGTIKMRQEGTESVLKVYAPGQGTVELRMCPDEVLLFMVELSNGLAAGRLQELQERMQRELEREKRR